MNVPFWQPTRSNLKFRKEIDEALARCLYEKGELVLGFGDEITTLEKNFAKYIGAEHAILVGGGTHALFLSYKAIGLKPGDEVITTAHTFIGTIDQIVACGATPVLVDIGGDGLIDPE